MNEFQVVLSDLAEDLFEFPNAFKLLEKSMIEFSAGILKLAMKLIEFPLEAIPA